MIMMHLGDEDDEFCSVDRFGSDLLTKENTKIIKKFGYGSPRQKRVSSIEFGSVRFDYKFA
jgi:hypothetical protein